jgi:hypothetical protein
MRGIITTFFVALLFSNIVSADERIDTAVELGIISSDEAIVVENGVIEGTMDVIDVKSDEGILTFAVIYYDDDEEEEEESEYIKPICLQK